VKKEEVKAIPETARENNIDKIDLSEAYFVRAKYVTRLERIKKEATRLNNKDSVAVAAGTCGAIAAYAIIDNYCKTKDIRQEPIAMLGITAAAAYTIGYLADLIFNAITK
jgi:hypothetical protein